MTLAVLALGEIRSATMATVTIRATTVTTRRTNSDIFVSVLFHVAKGRRVAGGFHAFDKRQKGLDHAHDDRAKFLAFVRHMRAEFVSDFGQAFLVHGLSPFTFDGGPRPPDDIAVALQGPQASFRLCQVIE